MGSNLKLKKAFSLVEMSVVLIIMGLIAAGIFTAHAQIKKQAVVKSIIEQISTISQSAYSFKDKYGSWPGDYKSTIILPTGNGNGIIDTTGLYTGNERVAAFKQLVAAGLYRGNYSGDWTVPPFAPNGPVTNSKYFFGSHYLSVTQGLSSTFQVLTYAGYDTNIVVPVGGSEIPVLNGQDLLMIDEKIDDAYPSTGIVRGNSGTVAPYCYLATTADPNKAYDVTEIGKNCVLYMLLES